MEVDSLFHQFKELKAPLHSRPWLMQFGPRVTVWWADFNIPAILW